MTPLRYDPAVLERFPAIRAALVVVEAHPGAAPPALRALHAAAQQEVASRLRAQSIADIPSITAWRRAFRHLAPTRPSTGARPSHCSAGSTRVTGSHRKLLDELLVIESLAAGRGLSRRLSEQ